MPLRVPVQSIGVSRDGKTVYPEIGKAFNFTASEVEEINALQKASGEEIYRKPTNETEGVAAPAAPAAPVAPAAPTKTLGEVYTVPQLKELAAAKNIDLGEATKKDDIVAILSAAGVTVEPEASEEDDI